MNEQSVPRVERGPWSVAPWGIWLDGAQVFASVRIAHGISACCTQCGEMIVFERMACVATLQQGEKWLTLHFHRPCYLVWERIECGSAPLAVARAAGHPFHDDGTLQHDKGLSCDRNA
jgi:hypothetical protein